jgi:hypothetical protein
VFGGLLLENITQAVCRDIFVEVMPRLEAAGYSIVAHTHDEYCCEVSEDLGSLDEFLAIITTPPSWAPDLPIAAKGRISDRLIEIPELKSEAAIATDNALDNAARDLAERDELTEVLCKQDENDEQDLEPAPVSTLEPIPAVARVLWDSPSLAAQAPPSPEPEPPSPQPPPMPPPSPSGGPGESNGGSEPPAPTPQPANGHGNGASGSFGGNGGNGYPHGENTGPSAGPVNGEYVYKTAAGRLHMRVVRRVEPPARNRFRLIDGKTGTGSPAGPTKSCRIDFQSC